MNVQLNFQISFRFNFFIFFLIFSANLDMKINKKSFQWNFLFLDFHLLSFRYRSNANVGFVCPHRSRCCWCRTSKRQLTRQQNFIKQVSKRMKTLASIINLFFSRLFVIHLCVCPNTIDTKHGNSTKTLSVPSDISWTIYSNVSFTPKIKFPIKNHRNAIE